MVLTKAGLAGRSEVELLSAFCEACRCNGLELGRAVTFMGTLHPQFEERVCRWDYRECVEAVSEYSADEDVFVENWKDSALFHLMDTGKDEVRRRIGFGDSTDFYGLKSLREAGQTDFVAFACRFGGDAVVGEIKCFYAYFTNVAAQGFSDDDIGTLRQLVLHLAPASRCATMDRVAKTVASVYLGDDVAKQVFHGEIVRGRTTRLEAVVWFSDLSDFTRISDASDANEIIPLLNDYSEAVISSILAAGGNVLKLIGDGTLAIFDASRASDACAAALRAYDTLRKRIPSINDRRSADRRPTTDVYVGLHVGEVFYGNIGSPARLDFTVVGRTVNEASRIAGLCHALSADILMSSTFAQSLDTTKRSITASVGFHSLRGVSKSMELYSLKNRHGDLGGSTTEPATKWPRSPCLQSRT